MIHLRKKAIAAALSVALIPMVSYADVTAFEEASIVFDTGSTDYGTSFKVDYEGNMIVAGTATAHGSFIAKYDSRGDQIWLEYYSSNYASSKAIDNEIVVDKDGNIYLIMAEGRYMGSIIKFDRDGNRTHLSNGWSSSYSQDYKAGAVYDRDNEQIYIRAATKVLKLDQATDTVVWSTHFDSSYNKLDARIADIKIDEQGNLYGVAAVWQNDTDRRDLIIKKFDTNGNEVWAQSWGGGANSEDSGIALELDGQGNVVVLGKKMVYDSSCSGGTCRSVALLKYTTDGTLVSTTLLDSADDTEALAMALDKDGNPHLTVHESGATGAMIQKFDGNHSLVWSYMYPDSSSLWAIDVDSQGNVVASGTSKTLPNSSATSITTVKLSNSGVEQWVETDTFGTAEFVGFGTTGEVYVGGRLNIDYNVAMIRYGEAPFSCQ